MSEMSRGKREGAWKEGAVKRRSEEKREGAVNRRRARELGFYPGRDPIIKKAVRQAHTACCSEFGLLSLFALCTNFTSVKT
jgi:hypothetical protein